jgi:hypothetical protein
VTDGPNPGTFKLMAPISKDAFGIYHECAGKAV